MDEGLARGDPFLPQTPIPVQSSLLSCFYVEVCGRGLEVVAGEEEACREVEAVMVTFKN